jgi:hypothetical protein
MGQPYSLGCTHRKPHSSVSVTGSGPYSLDKELRITDCVASHADLFSRLTRAHLRLSPPPETALSINLTTAGGCRSVPPKRILFRSTAELFELLWHVGRYDKCVPGYPFRPLQRILSCILFSRHSSLHPCEFGSTRFHPSISSSRFVFFLQRLQPINPHIYVPLRYDEYRKSTSSVADTAPFSG